MVGLKKGWLAALAAGVIVAACDGGASAVPTREQTQASQPIVDGASVEVRDRAPGTNDRAPVPRLNGKPMWSANRRFTAEQNAQRHFERNGADFGAASVKDYVAKAHDFVTDPPKGAETLTRENGDRLIYDRSSNVFAVATREGAPRTMFKPDEGAAYWTKVQTQEAAGPRRRRDRESSGEG
jgi:pyocin large subunit-like protein